ncbi:hypothetical protein [Arthrobacter sp. MMS18-M83]|uniref:hypothetical protein n=1 Tax=Arthrobacter sp. MMS18-M83 TaxID=2996261 RepID=UPI00227C9542|nr:hypothetical protein [Arthrobacter sp. MMS18-M83]WAH95734.1 hypothetical protein OW521_14940 [Arthrobacter sp. MMS18-M83]
MSLNTIAASALSPSISETEGIHIMVMAALITVSGALAVTGVVFVLLTAPLVAVAFRRQRTSKRASRAMHGAPHSAEEESLASEQRCLHFSPKD